MLYNTIFRKNIWQLIFFNVTLQWFQKETKTQLTHILFIF